MTAFDNIKVNNWPATSNDLEDFLVLELPLNDEAALTSSRRDIVAGSKVLFPKRTLTNNGSSSQAFDPNAGTTINIAASEYSTTGTVSNPGNLFDGNTSTSISSSDGSRIYWTPASNISVSKFEVYFTNQYGGYKIGVEVTGGSSQIIVKDSSATGNSPGWVEFSSIAGDTIGPNNQIMFRSYRSNDTDPGVLGIAAVRVNDKIVTTAEEGLGKKHYDNNAVLTATSNNYIQTSGLDTPDSNDYTYECWAIADGTISNYSLFHTNPTSRAGILFLFGSSTAGQLYFGNGSSWSNYVNLTWTIDSNWHHYAVVRQGGGNVNLYIDGQLNTSFAAGAHTHGELVLGRQSGDNNLYWNGAIQDVRVYKTAKYTSNFTPPGAILS